MTQSTTRATLSERYKAIRQRLGDPRTPPRPIIPRDRIRPDQVLSDQAAPIASDQAEPVASDQMKKDIELPRFKEGIEIIKIQPRQSKVILEDVAERHGLTVDELKSQSRKRRFTEARQEAFYLLRQAGYSWPQCATFCGMSDHTTAIHGASRYEAKLKAKGEI